MLLHGSFYRKLIFLLKNDKDYAPRLKLLPGGQIVVQCTPTAKRSQKTCREKMYRVRCHSIH